MELCVDENILIFDSTAKFSKVDLPLQYLPFQIFGLERCVTAISTGTGSVRELRATKADRAPDSTHVW